MDKLAKRNLLLTSIVDLVCVLLAVFSCLMPLFGTAEEASAHGLYALMAYLGADGVALGSRLLGWGYFLSLLFAIFFCSLNILFLLHEKANVRYWGIPGFVFPLVAGVFGLFIAPISPEVFIIAFLSCGLGLWTFSISLR